MAGRTNSSKVTKVETGLPGSPNRRVAGRSPVPSSPGARPVPNANGLPGWTATRHRSTVPKASNAARTTSYGPTDTPPDTISASAPSISPAQIRDLTSSSRSLAMPRTRGSPPASSTSATRPGPLASGMPAGPRSLPGDRTSSPVARIPTIGRRWTLSWSSPTPAARLRAAGVSDGAGAEDRRTRREIAARAPDRATDGGRRVDQHPGRQRTRRVPTARSGGRTCGVEGRGRLDRDHRVRARWHGGARRDADRAAAPDRDLGRLPSPDLADHLEARRSVLGRPGDVGRPDGVAVHRGVVPGRQRDRAGDRLGDHPAARLDEPGDLGRRRAGDRREDGASGLLDAQQPVGAHEAGAPPVRRRSRPPASAMALATARRVTMPVSAPASRTGSPSRPLP